MKLKSIIIIFLLMIFLQNFSYGNYLDDWKELTFKEEDQIRILTFPKYYYPEDEQSYLDQYPEDDSKKSNFILFYFSSSNTNSNTLIHNVPDDFDPKELLITLDNIYKKYKNEEKLETPVGIRDTTPTTYPKKIKVYICDIKSSGLSAPKCHIDDYLPYMIFNNKSAKEHTYYHELFHIFQYYYLGLEDYNTGYVIWKSIGNHSTFFTEGMAIYMATKHSEFPFRNSENDYLRLIDIPIDRLNYKSHSNKIIDKIPAPYYTWLFFDYLEKHGITIKEILDTYYSLCISNENPGVINPMEAIFKCMSGSTPEERFNNFKQLYRRYAISLITGDISEFNFLWTKYISKLSEEDLNQRKKEIFVCDKTSFCDIYDIPKIERNHINKDDNLEILVDYKSPQILDARRFGINIYEFNFNENSINSR